MDTHSPDKGVYHAYLLRIWSEPSQGSGPPVWRFVLMDSQTRKQHGFQSLEALFDFLAALTQAENKSGKNLPAN
jgi:hypothetical protein